MEEVSVRRLWRAKEQRRRQPKRTRVDGQLLGGGDPVAMELGPLIALISN